jgi:2-oxoglutarate dehydrogenase complex dehydrogenase (E1) component-like enzyme
MAADVDQTGLAAAPDDEAGTPQEQPAAPPTPAAAPSKPSVDVPALQAAYTQATQQNSAIKRALGLGKEAGADQVIAAIESLRAQPDEGTDPSVRAAIAKAEQREWNAAERIYGDDFVANVKAFVSEAQTTRDIDELVGRFHAMTQPQQQAAPAPTPVVEQPAAPAAATPESRLDLADRPSGTGEGVRRVRMDHEDIEALRKSGDAKTEFFKRLGFSR